MPDLDHLQEHDPDQRRRNLATLLVLATVLLGLFGAVFSHWSHAVGHEPRDLDVLKRLVRLQPTAAAQDGQPDPARELAERARGIVVSPSTNNALDASKLTFERALTGHEDRPELVAALEAAARDEEPRARRLTETNAMAATRASASARDAAEAPSSVSIPAGLSASAAGQQLERSARHDKLVAAAMQRSNKGHVHASGNTDGGFLLHVISYETRPAAEALANGLRDKGHEAFVESGDVDGRGRYFRVRIGPFASKPAAEVYRRAFEASERMNTIVIHRGE